VVAGVCSCDTGVDKEDEDDEDDNGDDDVREDRGVALAAAASATVFTGEVTSLMDACSLKGCALSPAPPPPSPPPPSPSPPRDDDAESADSEDLAAEDDDDDNDVVVDDSERGGRCVVSAMTSGLSLPGPAERVSFPLRPSPSPAAPGLSPKAEVVVVDSGGSKGDRAGAGVSASCPFAQAENKRQTLRMNQNDHGSLILLQ
jgi:hypothetical protein